MKNYNPNKYFYSTIGTVFDAYPSFLWPNGEFGKKSYYFWSRQQSFPHTDDDDDDDSNNNNKSNNNNNNKILVEDPLIPQ